MCHWMRRRRGKEFRHQRILCSVQCSKLPREGNEEVDTLCYKPLPMLSKHLLWRSESPSEVSYMLQRRGCGREKALCWDVQRHWATKR
ncbi:hypothetical protein, conserved [Eimeria necatrix]|uniref:Uncharacterized protein n=1 Tax=Eimeria necatrix TaxID=51315 RepID=U6MZH3_9EIME|nr:hypothetical protein, conserved [Eimeria necatrix]CDJ69381.1 hypothetical protein, conserved [Eimeria necatrix]